LYKHLKHRKEKRFTVGNVGKCTFPKKITMD
jgi:hypothetical protein